eukprot:7235489-Alexandrium_andersonii.AAC.1
MSAAMPRSTTCSQSRRKQEEAMPGHPSRGDSPKPLSIKVRTNCQWSYRSALQGADDPTCLR